MNLQFLVLFLLGLVSVFGTVVGNTIDNMLPNQDVEEPAPVQEEDRSMEEMGPPKHLRRLPSCKVERGLCSATMECCQKSHVCRHVAGQKVKRCLACCKKLKPCKTTDDCCDGLKCDHGICL